MREIAARELMLTPIGKLSIASSEKGIAALDILPNDSPAVGFVSSQGAGEMANLARTQLSEYFASKRRTFELPLDLQGTEFQMDVWLEIASIPFGETLSYGQIATRIGRSAASRAVGGAVGANPVPIIIPCHRVLGSAGKITGYSGGRGVPTKVELLELEGINYR